MTVAESVLITSMEDALRKKTEQVNPIAVMI
jgi:hypothetical protein